MKKNIQDETPEIREETAVDEVTQLQVQLEESERKYQRALADYQNLVRRTQQDAVRRAKLATKDFVTDLIQPLNHLSLAAGQLSDPGLTMVMTQLWQTLNMHGLEEIECLGTAFDAELMEVVEITEKGKKVTKIVSPGYRLHGEVIQFAKVILD